MLRRKGVLHGSRSTSLKAPFIVDAANVAVAWLYDDRHWASMTRAQSLSQTGAGAGEIRLLPPVGGGSSTRRGFGRAARGQEESRNDVLHGCGDHSMNYEMNHLRIIESLEGRWRGWRNPRPMIAPAIRWPATYPHSCFPERRIAPIVCATECSGQPATYTVTNKAGAPRSAQRSTLTTRGVRPRSIVSTPMASGAKTPKASAAIGNVKTNASIQASSLKCRMSESPWIPRCHSHAAYAIGTITSAGQARAAKGHTRWRGASMPVW